jgi:hypothetical protein
MAFHPDSMKRLARFLTADHVPSAPKCEICGAPSIDEVCAACMGSEHTAGVPPQNEERKFGQPRQDGPQDRDQWRNYSWELTDAASRLGPAVADGNWAKVRQILEDLRTYSSLAMGLLDGDPVFPGNGGDEGIDLTEMEREQKAYEESGHADMAAEADYVAKWFEENPGATQEDFDEAHPQEEDPGKYSGDRPTSIRRGAAEGSEEELLKRMYALMAQAGNPAALKEMMQLGRQLSETIL